MIQPGMCPTLPTTLANPAGLPDRPPPAALSQQVLLGPGFGGRGPRGAKLLLEENCELSCAVLPLAAGALGPMELEGLVPLEGAGPCRHLDFGVLASRTMTESSPAV